MGNLLATTPAEQLRSTIGAMIAAMNDGSVLIKSAPGEEINLQGPVIITGGLTGGNAIDVSTYGILPANTAAQNDTAMTALLVPINAGTLGKVRFLEGTYQFNTTVNWPTLTRNLVIEGAGLATIIQFTQADGTDGWVFFDEVPSNSQVTLRDFRMKSTAGVNSGNGIVLRDRGNGAIYSVWATDFAGGTGFLLDGMEQFFGAQVVARRNKHGVYLKQAAVGHLLGPNANSFTQISCQSNTDTGLWLDAVGNLGVFGGAIQGNAKRGVRLTGVSGQISLHNCYFESNNDAHVAGQGALINEGTTNDLIVINGNFNTVGDDIQLNGTMKSPWFQRGSVYSMTIGAGVDNCTLDDVSIGPGVLTDGGFATRRYRPSINRVSAAWTPGAIGAGATVTTNIALTGAHSSDHAVASYGAGLVTGLILSARSWEGSVDVYITNTTAGSLTPTASTVRVMVFGGINN